MLAFGILQIILFFKLWGMTNNVKELKDLYSERSKELYSCIGKLTYAVKNLNQSNDKPQDSKVEIPIAVVEKEEKKQEKIIPVEKKLPLIDENSNEFKQRLRKWKILNGKGFTEQAINEYMEYTGRSRECAIEFMKTM